MDANIIQTVVDSPIQFLLFVKKCFIMTEHHVLQTKKQKHFIADDCFIIRKSNNTNTVFPQQTFHSNLLLMKPLLNKFAFEALGSHCHSTKLLLKCFGLI